MPDTYQRFPTNLISDKRLGTKPSDIFKRAFILTVRNILSTVHNVSGCIFGDAITCIEGTYFWIRFAQQACPDQLARFGAPIEN